MDWIACRTPTRVDGDKNGSVIALAADGQWCMMNWHYVDLGQPWIPFCPPPAAIGAAATTKPDTSTTCDLVDSAIHDDLLTPSQELVLRWSDDWHRFKVKHVGFADHIATQGAHWGADQELEACCKWLHRRCLISGAEELRSARRPKPPSLAEQALAKTEAILNDPSRVLLTEVREALELNRRTLKRLQELENRQ